MQIVLPEPVPAAPLAAPRKPLRVGMVISGDTLPGWAAALAVKLQNVPWATPLLCATPSVAARLDPLPGDAGKPVPVRLVDVIRTPLRQTNADLLILLSGDAATVRQLTPSYPAGIWWCEHASNGAVASCRLRMLPPGRREAFTAFESHSLPSAAAHWAQNFLFERQLRLYYELGMPSIRPYHAPMPAPLRGIDLVPRDPGNLAAIPRIACHDGRWWKLQCLEAPLYAARNRDLYVFSCVNPDAGAWVPHPLNPVLSDVRCAVTVDDLFERDGFLIRPTAARLQRIVRLTEEEYVEEAA